MDQCCRDHADAYLSNVSPLFGYDAPLREHVIKLCHRWGPFTQLFSDEIVMRCSTSASIGVNAKTYNLLCDKCTNGSAPVVVIGSRLFYFIWRLGMVCATYWTSSTRLGGSRIELAGKDDWPGTDELDQVDIAYRMYFAGDWLTDQGLASLNESIFNLDRGAFAHHAATVDMAELFVLLHEIQHRLPLYEITNGELGIRLQFDIGVPISPERLKRWHEELNHDANAMWLLFRSAAAAMVDRGMSQQDARVQAGSAVFGGIDAALHTLQLLEEKSLGTVALQDAALARPFVRHPPSKFRRDQMSNVAYTIFSGRPLIDIATGDVVPGWREIARNVRSNMLIMDKLISAYKARKATG